MYFDFYKSVLMMKKKKSFYNNHDYFLGQEYDIKVLRRED